MEQKEEPIEQLSLEDALKELEQEKPAESEPAKKSDEISEAKQKALRIYIQNLQAQRCSEKTIRNLVRQKFGIAVVKKSKKQPYINWNKPPKETKAEKKKRIKAQHAILKESQHSQNQSKSES